VNGRGIGVAACLVALLLAQATPSHADRTTAEFYAQRGEKALREKDWAGAQAQLTKAIEEDATYAPAHGALGEALLGAGDRAGGISALRKAIAVGDATKPLPAAWAAPMARFRKRLAELDTAGVALDRIADKYVADLLSFGDRWVSRDLESATAALKDLVRLRPDDPKVKALAAKVEKADAASWTPLFNGRDKAGWDRLESGEWFVAQGSLVGTIGNSTTSAKTKEWYRGDFDIRFEAKLVKRNGPSACFAVLGAWTEDYHCSTFGVLGEKVVWLEEAGQGTFEPLLSAPLTKLKEPFIPEQWTVYEMRFRGDTIQGLVNGNVVVSAPRGPKRGGGAVGVKIQQVIVHFRRLEIRPR